jgi:hypothetical protein
VYVAQGDFLGGVRKISALGVVTTLAGNPTSCAINSWDVCVDGQGTVATFGRAQAVAVDTNLNVYVTDYNKHNVRMITSSGFVTTRAGSMSWAAGSMDGQGTVARFNTPIQIAVGSNAHIYISDFSNCKLRKISPSGFVSTFAGSGVCSTVDDVGTRAAFYYPMGLAVDKQGNVYVATQAYRLRLVTPSGLVRTLAGTGSQSVSASDGFGSSAGFDFGRSYQLAMDINSNIYLASTYYIRKMTSSGAVTTMWYHSTSDFHYGVAVDSSSNVYVSEYGAGRVFKMSQAGEGWRGIVGVVVLSHGCCACFVLSHQVPRVRRVIISRTPPLARKYLRTRTTPMRTRTCTTIAVSPHIQATSIVGTVLRARTTAAVNATLSLQVTCEQMMKGTLILSAICCSLFRFEVHIFHWTATSPT